MGISVRDDSISGSLAALAGPKPEDAWHRLVEWGPDVLPDVRGAYDMAKETGFRCLLIGIMAELRDGDSIQRLARSLRDPDPVIWKSALDALVTIGGGEAVDALRQATGQAPPEQHEWFAEAIEQLSG